MTRKLMGATGLATLALTGAAFGGALSPGDASASRGTTTATTATAPTAEDVSGPCDEAEHRNDPRCTGAPRAVERRDDRGERGTSGKHRRGKGKGNSGHGHSGRG